MCSNTPPNRPHAHACTHTHTHTPASCIVLWTCSVNLMVVSLMVLLHICVGIMFLPFWGLCLSFPFLTRFFFFSWRGRARRNIHSGTGAARPLPWLPLVWGVVLSEDGWSAGWACLWFPAVFSAQARVGRRGWWPGEGQQPIPLYIFSPSCPLWAVSCPTSCDVYI